MSRSTVAPAACWPSRRTPRLACGALLLALLLGACTAAPAVTPAPPTPVAAAAAPAASPAESSADRSLSPPVPVRVADARLASSVGVYVALDRGYFQEEGLDIDLVATGPPEQQIPLLATGQLDVGFGGPEPGAFNALARGIGVKFVLPSAVSKPGNASAALAVQTDHLTSGRYQGPTDLRGMTVAVSALHGANQFHIDRLVSRAGLSAADVELVAVPNPDMSVALANKRVDAVWQPEPFIAAIEARGIGRRTIVLGDVTTGPVSLMMLSPVFAEQHPAAAQGFVTALLRGLRDYWRVVERGEGDQGAMIDTLVKYTAVKDPAVYASLAANNALPAMEPNGVIEGGALAAMQDYYLRIGSQSQRVAFDQVVDASWVERALERLGRIQ